MKYIYFDASAGLSGDMILAALLDLGFPPGQFQNKMAELRLPVEISVREALRGGLRGLKVDIRIKKGKEPPSRRWHDIERFIRGSSFSGPIKDKALAVFETLFKAEAKVHGKKFEETHLHEAAADDAIIDVLGACYLASELNIGPVYCSPLNVGRGWVKSSHGVLPVPPPAVAEILSSAPVYSAWVEEELVTPTGAAILATWVKDFLHFPEMTYEKIGCGAGSRDFKNFANILRAFYGEEKDLEPAKRVFQVEANIDDANPQVLAHFVDQALRLGALDAFLTAVVMKKGRLGTKLTLLVDAGKIDELIGAIFRETSSIGVRYFPVERQALLRDTRKVKVLGEEIWIKIATLAGDEVNVQPEFSDCLRVAGKKGLPVKLIAQMAITEYAKQGRKKNRAK